MLILGLLGMYFDAVMVFVMKSSLLFRLTVPHSMATCSTTLLALGLISPTYQKIGDLFRPVIFQDFCLIT